MIETISIIISVIALILSLIILYKNDYFSNNHSSEKNKINFLDSKGNMFKLSHKCIKLLKECNDNYSSPDCYKNAWQKCQPPVSKGESICSNSNYAVLGWLECPHFLKHKSCDKQKYGCEYGEGSIAGCPDCNNNKLCDCKIYDEQQYYLHKDSNGTLFPNIKSSNAN